MNKEQFFNDYEKYVWLDSVGIVHYDNVLTRSFSTEDIHALLSCVEDAIYEEDGEERIDWVLVQKWWNPKED